MKNLLQFFRLPRHSVKCVLALGLVWTWALWPAPVSSAGLQHLNYTSLGDSIAFGLFALPGNGYVPLYARCLQHDLSLPVVLSPLGIPGWTSSDLLSALRSNYLFRISVFLSDVVTWNIGGNDLSPARSRYKAKTCGGSDNQQCLRDAVTALEKNWDGIRDEILALRRFQPTLVRTMDIYNPFVDEDLATDTWPGDSGNDFQVLNGYLNEANAYITASATARHIAVAAVHQAFNGQDGTHDPGDQGLLAFDHFHPSDKGHAVIAGLLRELGYTPIMP